MLIRKKERHIGRALATIIPLPTDLCGIGLSKAVTAHDRQCRHDAIEIKRHRSSIQIHALRICADFVMLSVVGFVVFLIAT